MPNLLDKNAGYLQQLQKLNLYTPNHVYDLNNSALVDAISTIVNGMEGVSAGFSNSLAARVLMPNTPIQQIGTVELAKNIARRAAHNLRDLVLPTLNIKGTDITFLKANYWNISNSSQDTSISGLLKTILDYTPEDNPIPFISDTFSVQDSNDYLKGNRGEGQIDAYNMNIERNHYQPDDDAKIYGGDVITQESLVLGTADINLLSFTNQLIADTSLKNGYPGAVEQAGDTINRGAYAYINKNLIKDGLPGFGAQDLIPRGDGTFTDDSQKVFLRSFNYQKPYQGTKDLMKFNHGNAGANSVLQTVFPNIAPAETDKDVRNLMFSIENLAYAGTGTSNLAAYETGMNGGRAMWFPPYGLEINESINVNWNTVDFIGRSEPIYTYNSRERQLNLSFMMIVDYPANLNDAEWRNNSDNTYNKFFRQDNEPKQKYTVGQIDQIKVKRLDVTPLPKTQPSNAHPNDFDINHALVVHYDNNRYSTTSHLTQDVNGAGQKDNDDFYARFGKMISFLNTDEGKKFKINIGGFASLLSNPKYNKVLSFFRAKDVYNSIVSQLDDKSQALADYNSQLSALVLPTPNQYANKKFALAIYGDTRAKNKNSTKSTFNADVIDRKVMVWLDYSPALDKTTKVTPEDATIKANKDAQNVSVTSTTTRGGEYKYFERLKNDEDKQLILQKYGERIDYFNPVFHSQTPEDFNTRLNFLQQCTLQGQPAKGIQNSVFGKPPVCVLRLGDFFHTKILITTINISYEPLLWDMNPEGIGMQPMLCNVTLDCKVLGGQDLAAPLTKLQNALSYNFYANTSVYNKQASNDATAQIKNQSKPNLVTPPAPKVTDQLANKDATVQNNANAPSGDLVAGTSKAGSISYSTTIGDMIELLGVWTGRLLIAQSDARFNIYVNNSTGTIDINRYNQWFNSLSNADKAANSKALGLITEYASNVGSASQQFYTLFGKTSDIQSTGKDGNKILNQSDGSFAMFGVMIDKINDFLSNVVLDISSQNNGTVNSGLSALNKYLEKNIQNVPFTT